MPLLELHQKVDVTIGTRAALQSRAKQCKTPNVVLTTESGERVVVEYRKRSTNPILPRLATL